MLSFSFHHIKAKILDSPGIQVVKAVLNGVNWVHRIQIKKTYSEIKREIEGSRVDKWSKAPLLREK